MRPDATLLRLYADTRAEDAFAEIVRRHLDGVYSSALRRVGGDTHLAQDVTQQVFVSLARKAGALAAHPALTSWLYIATRNEAANVVRTERRRKAREMEAQAMQNAEINDTAEPDWRRVGLVLDAAIDELGETDRTAVLLRFVERRAFAEIGTALNLSEDAARMRVGRALDRLRVLLARREIKSSSAALALALTTHAVIAAPAHVAANVVAAATSAVAASGSVAAAAGVFAFMSSTKFIVGGIGILAIIAALGLATNEIQASRAAHAALNGTVKEHALAMGKLREAEERLRAANEESGLELRLPKDRNANTPLPDRKETVAAPMKPAATPPNDARAAGDAFMARHPEVKRAVNEYARARVDFMYAELYTTLGLTPEQIEQFRAICMSGFGMGASGVNGESLSLHSGDGRDTSERNAQLEAALGPQGLKAFLSYAIWIEPAREIAANAAGALWFTDTPLSSQQADRLVEIMNQSRVIPAPGQHRTGGYGRFERFDWDALFAKAASFLSAPQLAALEGQRAREQLSAAYNRPVSPTRNSPADTTRPKEN